VEKWERKEGEEEERKVVESLEGEKEGTWENQEVER
jgi:hypothetical protein